MNKYEKLRTIETSRELPDDFQKEFENAISKAIREWQNGAMISDQFEDNRMELSFSKGYLKGCIDSYDKLIKKACEWLKEQDEYIGISFQEDFIERFKKAMED